MELTLTKAKILERYMIHLLRFNRTPIVSVVAGILVIQVRVHVKD